VIAWLVDELVALGHDVTLFATGDSKTKGNLQAVWPRALRLGRESAPTQHLCAKHVFGAHAESTDALATGLRSAAHFRPLRSLRNSRLL